MSAPRSFDATCGHTVTFSGAWCTCPHLVGGPAHQEPAPGTVALVTEHQGPQWIITCHCKPGHSNRQQRRVLWYLATSSAWHCLACVPRSHVTPQRLGAAEPDPAKERRGSRRMYPCHGSGCKVLQRASLGHGQKIILAPAGGGSPLSAPCRRPHGLCRPCLRCHVLVSRCDCLLRNIPPRPPSLWQWSTVEHDKRDCVVCTRAAGRQRRSGPGAPYCCCQRRAAGHPEHVLGACALLVLERGDD
jgi:hypothetical protein